MFKRHPFLFLPMTQLQQALIERFGEHRVAELPGSNGDFPLLVLELESRSPVTVILTNGLNELTMPVADKYKGREHIELYFCLPSYWDWQAIDDPSRNWVYEWIRKMANYLIEKNAWFGPGHTIPNGKEAKSISETMKQNHFILLDPILLSSEMVPITIGERTIHFMAITPIFQDEMDYKQAKGTFKLLQKFSSAGVTEKLDDFRSSVLRSKWSFWRKQA